MKITSQNPKPKYILYVVYKPWLVGVFDKYRIAQNFDGEILTDTNSSNI